MGKKTKEEKGKRKESELVCAAKKIFSERPFLTYNELCIELQEHLDIKERTDKNYIRYMQEREIVINDPSNSSYLIIGFVK